MVLYPSVAGSLDTPKRRKAGRPAAALYTQLLLLLLTQLSSEQASHSQHPASLDLKVCLWQRMSVHKINLL